MYKLGIIIINWNSHHDTIECITSIRNNEVELYPIFLLDNGSEKQSVENIEEWLVEKYGLSYRIMTDGEFIQCNDFSNCSLFFIKAKTNLGFAKGNNFVWNKIMDFYDYVLLLNNDTVISENAFTKMLAYMDSNPDTGVISCDIRLYSKPGQLWIAGGYFAWYGDRKYFKQKKIDNYKKNGVMAIKSPYITGCVLMVRKEITKKYGMLTEKFFLGEEDFNYCKRLAKNQVKVETLLDAVIYHKVGSSRVTSRDSNNMILYYTSRIIDLKEFYSPLKWQLWSLLYIIAIFIKICSMKKSVKEAVRVAKHVFLYSHKYNNVSYEIYSSIIYQ